MAGPTPAAFPSNLRSPLLATPRAVPKLHEASGRYGLGSFFECCGFPRQPYVATPHSRRWQPGHSTVSISLPLGVLQLSCSTVLQSRPHQVSGAIVRPLQLPPQRATQLAPEPTVEIFHHDVSNTMAPVRISPGMTHPPSRLYLSDIHHSVPCKFRALTIMAASPSCDASYPLPVRQASALPSASSRCAVTRDTLAVQLTLPLAGRVEDLHLQVSAPCRAHHQKARFRGLISGSLSYPHHSSAFTFFGLRDLCSDFFFKPSEAIWLELSPYWARTSFLETPILPCSSREESLRSSRMASRAT